MSTDFYDDGQAREMAKWAHDRNDRAMREREAAQKANLCDLIYEGYYEDE